MSRYWHEPCFSRRSMFQGAEHLIVVRRGETALFHSLGEQLSRGSSAVRVIWDRRMRDRRVIIRDDVAPERRQADRRAALPLSYVIDGFLVARASGEPGGPDLASLVPADHRAAPVCGPAESRAHAVAGSGACPHLCGRGLRTDDDALRVYAQRLREGGRHAPNEWPPARLRGLSRGSAA